MNALPFDVGIAFDGAHWTSDQLWGTNEMSFSGYMVTYSPTAIF